MTILRPVVPDDSAEVARLLRENRDFMAPFEPLRDERFFTSEGQRERIEEGIEEGSSTSLAIIVEGAIVGGVTISTGSMARFAAHTSATGWCSA